ncbi:UDP-glucose 4-epimerase, partial [Candidatus Daviesbacteria bacterium]|nr:UDP-glucose 4-epimerase [Candidatus Daviesbacteria bacterium]
FNICGASDDASLGYSNKTSTHLIPNAVKGALGLRPFSLTCPTVKTKDKTPIRDYINVVDLAEAHVRAVNFLLKGGENEVINLGTGTGNSVLEIIEQVQKVTGVRFNLEKSKPRDGETAKLYTSIKKAKKVLGWEPKRSLEDSIKSLAAWFTAHPKGWEE